MQTDGKTKVRSILQTPYAQNLHSLARGDHFFLQSKEYNRFDFVEVRNRPSIYRIDQIYYKTAIVRSDEKKIDVNNSKPVPYFMGTRFTRDNEKRLLIGTGTSAECRVGDIVKKIHMVFNQFETDEEAFRVHADRPHKNGHLQQYRHPEVIISRGLFW